MGIFFNPGNGSFTKDRNYEIYVDKTELLKYLNRAIGTPGNCIAVSHARRFGKSHAAGMIDAYYSLGSDSAKLFKGTKIASDPDYEKYRNKYNVIHLDISSFCDYHWWMGLCGTKQYGSGFDPSIFTVSPFFV